jgi:hypothetical protein
VPFAWDLSPWTLKILTKVQGESTKSISTSVQYVSDPPLENLDEVHESNPLGRLLGPPKKIDNFQSSLGKSPGTVE